MSRALILAALLAACGKPAEPPPAPADSSAPRIVVTFRHPASHGFELLSRQALDDFEAAHPGVRVVDEELPDDSDQAHSLLGINLERQSSAFDLVALDIIWISEFARAGWIQDLTPWFPPEEQARFLPGPMQAALYEGRPYAVPWYTDAGVLYYRKDLLEKYHERPPETWSELIRIAREIVSREGDPNLAGFVWQARKSEGLVCNALEYLGSNGVRLLDERGRWAADDGRARAALGLMTDLLQPGGVTPELVLAADEETTRHIFGEGHAVFLRNWPYARGLFNRPDSAVAGKFGIAPLPHFPGSSSVGTLGGWFLGVNRYSRQPELAYELAAYLSSEAVQKARYLRIGYLPTRSALYSDLEMRARAPELPLFEKILEQARPRPATPGYAAFSAVLQNELSAVLAGVKPPERALRDLRRETAKLSASADGGTTR